MTTDDKSLSGLWRANASKDPGTDLASILDACRVISTSLVPNTEITFAGVTTAKTDMKKIILPAKDIGKNFPVPGDQVDIILGETVHEIGHLLFSEDKISYMQNLYRRISGYHIIDSDDRKYLANLANVFEDVYVDHLMTAYPGYHDYLKRERAAALAAYDLPKIVKPLTVKCDRHDILNALIYLTLADGKLPDGITTENLGILTRLADLAMRVSTKTMDKVAAVVAAWDILKALPNFIDHNTDGMMNQPQQEPEETPPVDQEQPGQSGEQDESGEQSGDKPEDGKEPSEDTPDDGEPKPDDSDKEPTEDSGDKDNTEDEPDDDGEPGKEGDDNGEKTDESEPTTDNKDEAEPNEVEEDEERTGDGDGTTDETEGPEKDPDSEPEPGEPEPTSLVPEKWEPVDLAAHLDDLVDDDTQLDSQTAQEVSKAIIEKRADLSQLVSYLAKDSHSTIVAYTPPENAVASAKARSHTADTEEKLRRILQDYRTKQTRDYRGLMSGRVSNRRLYRVAYGDSRVFQRRERPEEIDMAVCLLMDLSGSMQTHTALIEQVVCAITDAFSKEKLEFIACGYSNTHNDVFIPRLYDKDTGRVNLKLEKEFGLTPSYEGLAAAIAQLLRLGGTKKKVMFHFTDGHPNSGMSALIPDLLKDARNKGIIDIHVYLDINAELIHDDFKYLYGENCLSVSDISQLPDVIDQELRRRLEI